MDKIKSLCANLWFDWVVLTLIYIATFTGAGEISNHFRYIFNPLVGLFVPIGPWNLLAIFQTPGPAALAPTQHAWIYVLPLLFAVLFFGNWFGKIYISNIYLRIFVNLLILLVLTFWVDLIIWQKWGSWQNLAQAVFYVSHGRIDWGWITNIVS
jgi:hypothetical protein